MSVTLSLIIPAFNEQDRLPVTLQHIADFMASGQAGFTLQEVLIVDDGSADNTVTVAESWSGKLPIRCVRLPENKGKGAACREGMLQAKGDWLLLYDADAATPMTQVPKLLNACIDGKKDIAIGSRLNENVQMSLLRRIIGRIYHAVCYPLIPGITDAACGCKLFRREVAHDLFQLQRINRFAFDIEILFLARERGYSVIEIPVEWRAVPQSKVRILRDGTQMFTCVIGLYTRKVMGTHKIKKPVAGTIA